MTVSILKSKRFIRLFYIILTFFNILLLHINVKHQDLEIESDCQGCESEDISDTILKSFELEPKDQIWQPVFGTKHKFEVYSAFADVRKKGKKKDGPVIRLIATTKTKDHDQVFCRYYYDIGEDVGFKGK